MAKIKAIDAQEILNAKGLPAIEATVFLNDGKIGVASCSTGEKISNYEAVNLVDQDANRFDGQGVIKAVNNIKSVIAPMLVGKEVENQPEIDKIMIELDGTQNKSRLGANAILAVSMAAAKAGAEESVLPLFLYLRQFAKKDHGELKIPVPIFNFINGKSSDRKVADFYEFLLVPASSKPYLESIQIGESIHKSLKQIVEAKYSKSAGDYDEGFAPDVRTNMEALSLIQQAAANTSAKLGFDLFLGLNIRASTFFKDEKYRIKDFPTALSSKDLISYYQELNKNFHILYIEDPLDQDDWDGWQNIYEKMSATTIIAGGDLIATNPYRLQMAIDRRTINAIVIKPNQIGTVIEALSIAEAAKDSGLRIVVSHRSSETNDDFIADFAVAIGADYIKIGSLSRGENISKYNRLLQIDSQLKVL